MKKIQQSIKSKLSSLFLYSERNEKKLSARRFIGKAAEEVENVVIYHAMTAYQFLQCVTDKLLNNEKKCGVFLISKFVTTIYPDYHKLVEWGCFKHILIYDFNEYSNKESIEEFEEGVLKYYDKLLANVGVRIEESSEIHIAGAHHGFGSYVCLKKMPFYFYEEAAGILSNPTIISSFEKNNNPIKYTIMDRLGLYEGKNELIIETRCVLKSQNSGFINNKAKNYELVDQISRLGDEDKLFLLDFFGVPQNIPFKQDNLIVLGQQLYHQGHYLNESNHILTYQLLIDYYVDNEHMILKPHPADLSNYESYLDNVIILRAKFPSELLPFIPGATYQKAITISSTAISNLQEYVYESRFIGYGFLDFKKIIHRCYVAFAISKYLRNKDSKHFHYGIDNTQMRNFITYSIREEELLTQWLPIGGIPENSISIIDNVKWAHDDDHKTLLQSMKRMDNSSILIFINQQNDYCFYDIFSPELLEYIVPIVIKKYQVKDSIVASLQDEVIYVFCKDERQRSAVRLFSTEKLLKQTGIKLEVSPLSDEEFAMKRMNIRVSAIEQNLRDIYK